jgi:alpha-galactosidase
MMIDNNNGGKKMKRINGIDGVDYIVSADSIELMKEDIQKVRDEMNSKMDELDEMYLNKINPSVEFKNRLDSLRTVAWIRRFE